LAARRREGGRNAPTRRSSRRACRPSATGSRTTSLRRTFASLLYEAGASPAYVMSQMGHTRAALALEGYAKKMARRRNTGARMDALIKPDGWCEKAQNGER